MTILERYRKYYETFSSNYGRMTLSHLKEGMERQLSMMEAKVTKDREKFSRKKKILPILLFRLDEKTFLLEGIGKISQKEYNNLQYFLSTCEMQLDFYALQVSELKEVVSETTEQEELKKLYSIVQTLIVLTDETYQRCLSPKLQLVEDLPQKPTHELTIYEQEELDYQALAYRKLAPYKKGGTYDTRRII